MLKNKLRYYHPTTTLFLDDNKTFLQSLTLHLGRGFSFECFNDPASALAAAHHDHLKSLPEPWRAPLNDALNTSASRNKTLNHRRRHPSVLVVDYDMPEMNGIEVCKAIKNPFIKKLMLTGVADEKIAINALNDQQIDYYLHKSDPQLHRKLPQAIKQLQQSYFETLFPSDQPEIEPSYLNDSAFLEFFRKQCEQLNIEEYYYIDNPTGFVLIDKECEPHLLLVLNDEELEAHIELANAEHAPQSLLKKLSGGEFIPYFHEDPCLLYSPEFEEAERFLYPATRIYGRETYYYALIRNPSLIHLLPREKQQKNLQLLH